MYFCFTIIAGLAAASTPTSRPAVKIVELEGDVRIHSQVQWRDAHYRIRGNLIFESGGELSVEHATVEIMNDYSRQFNFQWRGGRLITRHSTLGGSKREGSVRHSNFEVYHGEWICEDTTVRNSYGILFGDGERISRLRATRLTAGPSADSIIMDGTGDVYVEDSTFCIALNAGADQGGTGVFDFPVDRPVTMVYDRNNVPGVRYRLELVRTHVPAWFLFVRGITTDGPPVDIQLRHAPRLIPALRCNNLTGELRLPYPWPERGSDRPSTLKTGNVTWTARAGEVDVITWAAYFWGPETNVTLLGPTSVAELMAWHGRVALLGTPGTFDAETAATTIEVGFGGNIEPSAGGPPAELVIRNAAIAHPGKSGSVRGQITAHGGSRISIEQADCGDLLLLTKDQGTIELRDLQRRGRLETREEGGPIRFLDPTTTATP